jgi:branched-chain amino acid transport system permease protein
MRMSKRTIQWTVLGVACVAVFVTAPGLGQGNLNLGVTLLSYLAIAQAWNVLAGFSGQFSLGSAAFVAAGGYTAALALADTGASWPVALLLAAVVSALLATLLSVPLLRLRGDYFAVGTLAISVAVQALLNNWPWAGGASGFAVPDGAVPSGGNLFQVSVVVAALAMGLAVYVRHSRFGLRLAAIGDNEAAAMGLGVAVRRHRVIAFVASSALIGLAGAVVAFQFIAVSPDEIAGLTWSLNAVLMTIVGGAGTVLGPLVGVVIVYYGLTQELANFNTLSELLEGALFIIIVRVAPGGVWPLACQVARRLAARTGWTGHQDETPGLASEPAEAELTSVELT